MHYNCHSFKLKSTNLGKNLSGVYNILFSYVRYLKFYEEYI